MKLEQKRNFEALLGDTFGFLRETGAHFFPTMLRVNFLYLLGVALFAYFAFSFSGIQWDYLPGGHASLGKVLSMGQQAVLKVGFSAWETLGLGACLLLLLVGAVVFMAYTPAYTILYRREGRAPAFRSIVAFIRLRAGRLVIYFLGLVLLSIPVVAVCIPLFILLALSIVGIAVIPLVLLLLMMMSYLLLYAYLDDENLGFFEAIDAAWKTLCRPFWRNVVNNGIVYLITCFLGMLPALIGAAFDGISSPGAVFLGVMCATVSLVLNFAISSLYSLNIGIIYFSSKARRVEQGF